jgi:hypothetical protein
MGPHAQDFDRIDLGKHLIDESMVDVDTPGIGA